MAGVESTTGADRTDTELANDVDAAGVDAAGVDTAGVDAADVDAADVDTAGVDTADTELITDSDETVFFDRLIGLRVFNSFDVATLSFKSISLLLTSSKNVTVKALIHLLKSGA